MFHFGRDLDQPTTSNNSGEPRVKLLPVLKLNAKSRTVIRSVLS